jgi:hypothetical protein
MNYETAKTWLGERVHRRVMANSVDFEIMNEMLKKHPDYGNWINVDIEYFQITRAPKKKSLQVYMKMKGISRPRIVSWTACVTGKKRKNNNLSAAMRSAIKYQIDYFSFRNPVKRCFVCDTYNRIEVDHFPKKFRDIKKEFLLNVDEGNIPKLYFHRTKWILPEGEFLNGWQAFHEHSASYRYLCDTCNQKSH